MAQIQKGDTFADGQLVTAARLNALLDSALLNTNAITDQALITTGAVADLLLVYQVSTATLKKITFDDLISINTGSGLGVLTVSQIFGNTGLSIATGAGNITIAGYNDTNIGNGSSASGETNIYSYNDVNIDSSIGNVVIACTTNFTTTGAIKIPVGTTAQRPATLATGQFRYNTTTGSAEFYNSSVWVSVSEQAKIYVKTGSVSITSTGVETTIYTSPALTIPADETWTYQIQVFTRSGYVTGSTRPDVNAVRFRVYNNATQIEEQYCSASPYGAHSTTWFYSKALTSADNGFIFNAKILNSVTFIDAGGGTYQPVLYRVVLNKVKTASLSDNASCI
jgi:hypothetical protein